MSAVRRILAPVLALLLPSCVPMMAPPASTEGAYRGPALWQVSDADTTIYLFGTVHALPKDKQWFAGPVARAYEGSDELVTEISLGDASSHAQAIATRALLPQGQSLRELMTAEDRMQFEEALVALGLSVEAMDRFEPWYAAMTLSLLPVMQAGYDPQAGVEAALSGRSDGKKRSALETVDQQIELFDGLPMEAQLAFLDKTTESVTSASSTLDAMVAEWLEGDADQLARLLNDELADPVLHKRLLTDRNANWAEWIGARLQQPGTVFVAVGAGHLAGKDSVQDYLKKRGLKVRRVWQ
ncbi:TraB/GumN family protein [Altererythrobacter soli]|uniref:TraB/GumN family protein n=1 Tax=Croceibacterium soli TaxID=1739690 RepID=A0A6I4UYB2_9SPHN|nr:TraB/GumN family protein [Croceibacterium soli]MXP42307.1 TraB/GumN family protein [Croceibacterium soli]